MDDRITVSRRTQWERIDTPPANRMVEIWHGWEVIDAYYDGQVWRTQDGTPIAVDAWWREKANG